MKKVTMDELSVIEIVEEVIKLYEKYKDLDNLLAKEKNGLIKESIEHHKNLIEVKLKEYVYHDEETEWSFPVYTSPLEVTSSKNVVYLVDTTIDTKTGGEQ